MAVGFINVGGPDHLPADMGGCGSYGNAALNQAAIRVTFILQDSVERSPKIGQYRVHFHRPEGRESRRKAGVGF